MTSLDVTYNMCILRGRALVLVIFAFLTFCESVYSRNTFKDIAHNGTMDQLINVTSAEERLQHFKQEYPDAVLGRGPVSPIVKITTNAIPVECRKLKAKRYLSDGNCYSTRPIVDYECGGSCVPSQKLDWWSDILNYWTKNKVKEYRCVEDVVKRRKVTLLCRNGETRTYRVKVVKSCKCKAYEKRHNKTKRQRNRSRRKRRRRLRKKNRKNSKRTQNKNRKNS